MDYLIPLTTEGTPGENDDKVSSITLNRWNEERVEIFMLLLQHEMMMRLQYTPEELEAPRHDMYLTSKAIAKRLDSELMEVVDHMVYLDTNFFIKFYRRRDIDVFCDIPSVRAFGHGKTKNIPTFGFIRPDTKKFLAGVPKETVREEVTWLIETNRMYDFELTNGWTEVEKHPKAV